MSTLEFFKYLSKTKANFTLLWYANWHFPHESTKAIVWIFFYFLHLPFCMTSDISYQCHRMLYPFPKIILKLWRKVALNIIYQLYVCRRRSKRDMFVYNNKDLFVTCYPKLMHILSWLTFMYNIFIYVRYVCVCVCMCVSCEDNSIHSSLIFTYPDIYHIYVRHIRTLHYTIL